MRLDRPIGTWLLLLPGWIAILLAGGMNVKLMILFGVGAVLMRGAGCIINDLWDHKLDQKVERTKIRPLASGRVSRKQASIFLMVLLALSFLILIQLNKTAIILGLLSIPLIVAYPLMKRITWWPQAFLGLTFNWGYLMGWAAASGGLSPVPLILFLSGVFWTLAYDTIYAHQDLEDDVMVGIKSTARLFGQHSKKIVSAFYAASWVLTYVAFIMCGAGTISCLLLLLPALHAAWQMKNWKEDVPISSLRFFRAARDYGLLILLAALFFNA
jgi:4-hydroxybenzoate polyprenyltransferase